MGHRGNGNSAEVLGEVLGYSFFLFENFYSSSPVVVQEVISFIDTPKVAMVDTVHHSDRGQSLKGGKRSGAPSSVL